MLQRLQIALEQVKVGNTSENLLNKICQIIYSLNLAKEITKKVYNIMNSIKLENRMNTIFMNFGNNKTSHHHRLLLNLSDKVNWKSSDTCVAYQILVYTIYKKVMQN